MERRGKTVVIFGINRMVTNIATWDQRRPLWRMGHVPTSGVTCPVNFTCHDLQHCKLNFQNIRHGSMQSCISNEAFLSCQPFQGKNGQSMQSCVYFLFFFVKEVWTFCKLHGIVNILFMSCFVSLVHCFFGSFTGPTHFTENTVIVKTLNFNFKFQRVLLVV